MNTHDIPTSVFGVPVRPMSTGHVWAEGLDESGQLAYIKQTPYAYLEMHGNNDKCNFILRRYTCAKHDTHRWEAMVKASRGYEDAVMARDAKDIEYQLMFRLRSRITFELEGLVPPCDPFNPPGYTAPAVSTFAFSPETRAVRGRMSMSYEHALRLGGQPVYESMLGKHGPGVYLPLTDADRTQVWVKLDERVISRRRGPRALMFFPAVDDYSCKCLSGMQPRIAEELLQERLRIQKIRVESGWYAKQAAGEPEAELAEPDAEPEAEQPTEAEQAAQATAAAERVELHKRKLRVLRARLDVKYANWKLEQALFSEFLAGFAKAQK